MSSATRPAGPPDLTFKVTGMMCQQNCAATVQRAISSVQNVSFVEVSYPNEEALVWGNGVRIPEVITEVEDMGYEAELKTQKEAIPASIPLSTRPTGAPDLTFHVSGMMCQQNCASTVQRAIASVPNVSFAEVSYPKEEAVVWGTASVEAIVSEVEDMGYEATLKHSNMTNNTNKTNNTNTSTVTTPTKANPTTPTSPTTPTTDNTADIVLHIKGMFDAQSCPNKIHSIVSVLDGVFNVAVSYEAKTCSIWGFADVDVVVEALATEGYGAKNANTVTPKKKRVNNSFSSGSGGSDDHRVTLNLDKLLRIVSLKSAESTLQALTSVYKTNTDVEGRVLTLHCSTSDNKSKCMESVVSLGYGDSVISASVRREYVFEVSGMSCANCATRIERALLLLPGISGDSSTNSVSVSSMTNKARILVDESANEAVGPRGVIEKITSMGYGCSLLSIDGSSVTSDTSTTESDGLSEWYTPLLVSLVLGIPVMTLHLSMSFSDTVMMYFDMPAMCSGGITLMQVVMLVLNLPILLIVGHRYYKGAVLGAMHGTFGMDCLVTVGTSITFLYSIVQIVLACHAHTPTTHVFFETTGMLLMFVTIGKFIEAYAKRRSFAAISNLLKLQPREVSIPHIIGCVFVM